MMYSNFESRTFMSDLVNFWVDSFESYFESNFEGKFMVWEKNLVPTEDDMKEIQEREYEFENASDMLAKWICNGGEITDDIFEKAYKEISLIFHQSNCDVIGNTNRCFETINSYWKHNPETIFSMNRLGFRDHFRVYLCVGLYHRLYAFCFVSRLNISNVAYFVSDRYCSKT